MRLFIDGKADAFMGFPPMPQELRAKKIGRVIVDTAQDRPWSQYFCCMLAANREFVAKHPVATKRAVRAFLKAADICAQEPERVAAYLATKGYETRYEIGLEVLKKLPYNRWREANPEDTLRFHALRLHEVGNDPVQPQQADCPGHGLAVLNELKKELKADTPHLTAANFSSKRPKTLPHSAFSQRERDLFRPGESDLISSLGRGTSSVAWRGRPVLVGV
jgi:NitT/TauT family transport system substrate-binding protein